MPDTDPRTAETDEDAAAIIEGGFRDGPPDRRARRRSTMRAFIRWAAVCIGLLLAFPAFFLFLWLLLFADFTGDRPFEAAQWREADLRVRGAMVDDLIDRKLLIGASREDVLELLGPSLDSYDENLRYSIDIGHRWGVDPWLYGLHVQLDPATGRVSDVWYTD